MIQKAPLILAADIGGTNTRVALLDGTTLRVETIKRYVNASWGGLEAILRDYLKAQNTAPLDAVSLALAGPIAGPRHSATGKLTNLDWTISAAAASAATDCGFGVLLNDLCAQGHALPFLQKSAFHQIQSAPSAQNDDPCLMIGLGTGLNVAPVHRLDAGTYVPPAEAGHISFAPQGDTLGAFGAALSTQLGHVAIEDILSGRGIERAYLHVAGQARPSFNVMELCGKADETALRAVGLVVQTLGHFAGDMALIHLPRGGIHFVGGVARALKPYLQSQGFLQCFAAKGRFSDFMMQFPICLIEDDYAALIGAASYAQDRLRAR